jgi:hypothetical protein
MKNRIKVLNKGKQVQEVATLEGCCKGVPSAVK